MPRKPLTRRSKNKLSLKQKAVVSDNLEKKIEDLIANDAIEALVISHMGYNIIVEFDQVLVACDWRQNIGYICAGDRVLLSGYDETNHLATIEAVLPRSSVIEKQNVYRGSKPFAANIDQLLVVITHEPFFQPSLLDRYLITAEMIGIDCLIYFNKIDCLTPESTQKMQEYQSIYERIPRVRWLLGSTKTGEGIDQLKEELNHHKTVISGQSGVGKSTLINTLIPDIDIQTMSISEASGLGKHSTTNSTLYHLDGNGFLIDTPGVRSFDTYHYDAKTIEYGYAEIRPFIGGCQFSNCSHTHEKKCAILTAIKDNKVSQLRYKQFLQALSEINN